jgi:photosystem II stability/assembly factor-like uncharacterized protein
VHHVPKQAFSSVDSGTTWHRLPDPPAAGELTDLTSVSATTAYATTQLPARLLVTTDGGMTWAPAAGSARTGYGYSNVDVADARHAWAMGDQGLLWRTTDGTTWQRLALPPGAPRASLTPRVTPSPVHPVPSAPADKDVTFTGVSFVDPLHGWAVGEVCVATTCKAVLRRTDDGGWTWRVAPGPPGTWVTDAGRTANAVSAVTFADDRNGWLYGDTLLATHDGGLHWKNVGGYTGDVVARDGVVWVVQYEGCASMFCGAYVRRAPVGGDAFTGEVGANLVGHGSFVATDALHAYLVDDGSFGEPAPKVVATSDGGQTWSTYTAPCRTALVRTIAASSPDDLWVACGGKGEPGREQHAIARSTDGGAHWRAAFTDGTGSVAALRAEGTGLAFLADDGARAHVTVTRDGRTWRTMPGLGVPGEVLAFGILDGTHGYALVGDAFFVMSDGASWERMTRP